MRVSLCLIAYNEEPRIVGAIASGHGLADEVIVVDGGSTDGTIAMARAAGARVIDVGNSDNLSANHNAAIDASTGDWIVFLDADELISNPTGLRAFLESDKVVGLDGLAVKQLYLDANDKPTEALYPVRVFRRGLVRYKYRWHEQPTRVDQSRPGTYGQTEFIFEHRRPEKPGVPERALYWLQLDLVENPGDPRVVYYLARQYLYLDELVLAKSFFQAYLEMPGAKNPGSAWSFLARIHGREGDREGQIRATWRSAECDPRRRNPWGQLAALYYEQARYHLAAALLRCVLALPMPDDVYEDYLWHGWLPWDYLARCMYHLGRYDEGLEYAARAVELEPGDERLAENLAAFVKKVCPTGGGVEDGSR